MVPTGDPVPGEATHFREHLIDMAGPGADLSPFAHTLNVVLRFRANLDRFPPGSAALTDGIVGSPDAIEYNRGVMQATLKVAARLGRVVEGVEPKDLKALADQGKKAVGSGVVAFVAVADDGKAAVVVGVTDDLTRRYSAIDLVRAGSSALGGKGGGGRPDMAQAGGPDGSKAEQAVEAIRSAIAG